MDQKTIAIENPGNSPIYVGTAAIMPGETRVFNEADVPVYLRPTEAEVEQEVQLPDDPIAELLKGTVVGLKEVLPQLTDEELAHAAALEQEAVSPRKSAMEALTAEHLRRVAGAAGGE